MDKIICRRREQQELYEALNSHRAELIVTYGRRRIGKTFLVTRYFEAQRECRFFYVVGIKNGLIGEQLEEFAKAIGAAFYNGATIATPKTWMKAFEELHRAINNVANDKKIVLFLDEFPWLVTHKSRVMQALEYYWNRYFTNDKRLKLIICGSSASWIIKNIIQNKGGLHNRITRQLIIKPFTLGETREFLKSNGIKLGIEQILQLYMVMGGVPHYLDQIRKGRSATRITNDLCFQETGLLFGEFDKLFSSIFDQSEAYLELIKIIAKSRYGVNRSVITEKTQLTHQGGRLTNRLKDLETAGFIHSFLPLSHSKQGLYYRLMDEYCYFYLKWIAPEKHTLLTYDTEHNYWNSKVNSTSYQSWAGYAFETICYKHIAQIRRALKIKAAARIGAWRYVTKKGDTEDGTQIDLLFDCDDKTTIICEIKYTAKPFVIDKVYYHNLLRKVDVYRKVTRTNNELFVALISANGVKPTIYSEELLSGVVTLDDLFRT